MLIDSHATLACYKALMMANPDVRISHSRFSHKRILIAVSSFSFFVNGNAMGTSHLHTSRTISEAGLIESRQAKVVLKAKNTAELTELCKQAKSHKLCAQIISDALVSVFWVCAGGIWVS